MIVGGKMILTSQVQLIVTEIDPLGFVSDHSALEEYGGEVEELTDLVNTDAVTEDNVKQIFETWFWADAIKEDKLEQLTRELDVLAKSEDLQVESSL